MTHFRIRSVRALLPAAMLAAGLAPTAAYAEDGVIRIGVTLRMVVENGIKYGQMTKDELEAVNASGGINGKKVEVILLDDECKPDKGIANVNRFIHQHKVHLVLGSTCSSVSLPMVDVTAKEEVPQIIPHSTNSNITKKGSAWVFRTSVSERFYASVHAKYLSENVGKKVAYLFTTDGAAISFAKDYMDYMRRTYKVEPLYEAQMQETDLDFRSHLLKIKSLNPDVLAIGGQLDAIARITQQAAEVGIPSKVRRVAASAASNAPVPELAGDAVVGLTFAAAFSCKDERPVAQAFVKMVQEKYKVRCPDHDFSQAYETAQIVKLALKNAKLELTDASLKADRAAIRDALANIRNYSGLASGPINFCKDPTPQCRDGNRTGILVEYTKGGKDYDMRVLARVSFDADFGL
ncbi:MAG TPA: ABC transporter substrate-binding protein [Hyphomicrobiaceae bacterium]|nr:ABC transporter substrate-binding protein [Hyphomicrobiaceae bacterium]